MKQIIDVIADAFSKDIEPEDVASVLQSEGYDVDVELVRKLYQKWHFQVTYPYMEGEC